jgi:hypothetical protein
VQDPARCRKLCRILAFISQNGDTDFLVKPAFNIHPGAIV